MKTLRSLYLAHYIHPSLMQCHLLVHGFITFSIPISQCMYCAPVYERRTAAEVPTEIISDLITDLTF